MSDAAIVVVGSVAYDTVETPAGSRTDQLGGSATYFSVASSYFASVGLVAVVGEDFRQADRDMFEARGVNTSGLESAGGNTFRWSGLYEDDLNTAITRETQLNVFADFSPTLQESQRSAPYLFLANIDPTLQRSVLEQMDPRPRVVVCDTMNLWIDISRRELWELIEKVDVLMINNAEAAQLSEERSLVRAAKNLLGRGLKALVVKRGEYGAVVFHPSFTFAVPAYPVAKVVDPTGAGDSFAGGFLGYLAAVDGSPDDDGGDALRRSAVVGSVMASFAVESFGLERLRGLTPQELDDRFEAFVELTRFNRLDNDEGLPRAPAN